MEWIGEILCTKGIHISIDGKALRAAMEKVKNFRAPMVLNAIDAATGLVLAQLPIQNKDWNTDPDHGADPFTGRAFCTDGKKEPAAVL